MKKLVAAVIVIAMGIALVACGSEPEDEKQAVYFDAPEYYFITEDELQEKLGQYDSVEDWTFNNAYSMRTYTYGTKEFIYAMTTDGSYCLVRISLYDSIPYTNKDMLYELFNVKKTAVNDNGTVITMDVYGDVYKIQVQDYDEQYLKWTQITYREGKQIF